MAGGGQTSSNRRAPKVLWEEPVEEGLRQLLGLTPVEISCGQCEVMSDCQRLVADGGIIPGSRTPSCPLHDCAIVGLADPTPLFTGVNPHLRGRCAVLRRKKMDAEDILKLLKRCDHPNVLKPSGVWESGDMVYITFPQIKGTLSQVNANELFIMDSAGRKDGFTKEGQKIFRDLILAIHHINEKAYRNTPSLVLPLQLGADRIFYQKIDGTGCYHILVGDFYCTLNNTNDRQRLPRYLNAKNLVTVKRFNWKGLGEYLKSLIGSNGNEELNQLRDVLTSSPAITFDDIMWEPALWDSVTKMHFIREVFYSLDLDTSGRRETVLHEKPKLGLEAVISLLGITSCRDDNLLDSVSFLRNKVVAHQEEPYHTYQGDKLQDVGVMKRTLERFILKEKPDYMLKLVAQIRPLKWIKESPLLRSQTEYIKVVKPPV